MIGFILFNIACHSEKEILQSPLTIVASVDTTQVRIGEKIRYKVLAEGSEDKIIQYPVLKQLSDSVQYQSFTFILNNTDTLGVTCEISYWDTGTFWTPAYQIQILNNDRNPSYSLRADQIQINVLSTITPGQQSPIKPIKGPVPVSEPLPIKIISMIGLLLVLMGTMVWVWKKRIQPPPVSKLHDIIMVDPLIQANERLSLLDPEANIKIFYVELSYLLRELVERVFYIRTLEMTTQEISENEDLFQMDAQLFSSWISLLEKSDLVKYAKYTPSLDLCNQDRSWASDFVQKIKMLSEI